MRALITIITTVINNNNNTPLFFFSLYDTTTLTPLLPHSLSLLSPQLTLSPLAALNAALKKGGKCSQHAAEAGRPRRLWRPQQQQLEVGRIRAPQSGTWIFLALRDLYGGIQTLSSLIRILKKIWIPFKIRILCQISKFNNLVYAQGIFTLFLALKYAIFLGIY